MKKVWLKIKLEFAYGVANMWYLVSVYVLEHNKRFSADFEKFAWDMHIHWFERVLSLCDEL